MVSLALLKNTDAQDAPQNFVESFKSNYAFVARNAQHVEINYDILESYATNLPALNEKDILDTEHHFISGNTEADLSYIIALDSMNFGSGFQEQIKSEGYEQPEGFYFKVSTILKNYYEEKGALSANDLANFTAQDVAEILQLPDIKKNPYSYRLASSYSTSVQEVGAFVNSHYNGSFSEMIFACEGRSENFVHMLTRLATYNDTCTYKGQRVPFYKRAISCAADLQDLYVGQGKSLFSDTDMLPCLADCDIPHVLRIDNILKYSEELGDVIDNHELIESGSVYEVELRACAVHAVEIMSAKSGRSAIEIDRILWHRAQEATYKAKAPHRCETKFY